MKIPAPLELYRDVVRPEWIDYNGHMNVAYYVLAFDYATDALLDYLGLDHAYKDRANCTTFVVDMNVTYKQEVREGEPLRFATRVLDADRKRLHSFHEMYHAEEGFLAATNEIMQVHIDRATRRVAAMADDLFARVEAVRTAHAALPLPEDVGRAIGIRRK